MMENDWWGKWKMEGREDVKNKNKFVILLKSYILYLCSHLLYHHVVAEVLSLRVIFGRYSKLR